MNNRNRLLAIAAVIWLAAVFCVLKAHAQSPNTNLVPGQFFNRANDRSPSVEICHIIKPAALTSLGFYGVHIENTSASKVYACLFDAAAKPADSTVPPGGCWDIAANSARDIPIVQGSIPFDTGIAWCLSTTDATYTAATAVGLFWTLYRGVSVTSTATSTQTPLPPTATPVPTSTPGPTNTPVATATVVGGTPTATATGTPAPTATQTPVF